MTNMDSIIFPRGHMSLELFYARKKNVSLYFHHCLKILEFLFSRSSKSLILGAPPMAPIVCVADLYHQRPPCGSHGGAVVFARADIFHKQVPRSVDIGDTNGCVFFATCDKLLLVL